MPGYIPPSFTPFVWQDAPSSATPLKSSNLLSDENNLASYIQSVITDYDSYARSTFAIQGNLPGQIENAAYWLSGTAGSRPVASAVAPGSFYRAVDTGTQSVSDGVSWHNVPTDTLGVPIGSIQQYGGSSDPIDTDSISRWLICDGRAISRTTYSSLYTTLGTAYGAGNGSTTFNLPDMRQRFPIGKAASGTASTLGSTGGAIDHTHSAPGLSVPGLSVPALSIGAHSHSIPGLSVPGLSVPSLSIGSHTHSVPSLSASVTVPAHYHDTPGYMPYQPGGGWFQVGPVPGGGVSWKPIAPSVGDVFNTTTVGNTGGPDGNGDFGASGATGTGTTGAASGSTGTGTTGTGTTGTGSTGSSSGSTGTGTTGTGTTGTGTTGTGNPPYLVVNFIIRAL